MLEGRIYSSVKFENGRGVGGEMRVVEKRLGRNDFEKLPNS